MKARSIDLSPKGLWTDPNPHSEVPQGALRQADDVILRRPGILEPRPGFATAIGGWTPPSGTARFAIPFDGDVLVWSLDGSTWTTKWLSDGATVSSAGNPPVGRYVPSASARQALYFGRQDNGVRKLESSADDTAAEAGLPRGLQGLPSLISTGTTWLAISEYAAYRIVYRRTDGNDYDVRSAPSGRMVERNSEAGERAVSLRLPLPSAAGLVAGDVIEVYRSVATSADKPSDDLYLALEHEITAAELTAGYADVEDHTPEESLGRALYTNVAQEGVEAENGRPPTCHEIATYRGSLFFARTTSRASRVLQCLSTQDWRLYGNADGIDGDFTDTDATVTNIGGITGQLTRAGGITVGQYIVEDGTTPGSAGTYIPANTKVSSLNSPTSIEMSNAATGTITNEALNFCDVITIGGTDYVAWSSTDPTNSPPLFRADTAEVSPQLVRDMCQELAYVINYQGTHSASVLSLGEDEFAIFVELLVWDEATDVQITNGYAWAPGGASFINSGQADLIADDKPNRLMWSKTDLPEAVPASYFADVGEEDKAILRLLATRDALWICKEDGLFRLTGFDPDSWRIDPVGPDTILLARKAAGVLRDAAVLWTSRGVVMLTDTGVDEISEAPIGVDLDAIESAIAAAGDCQGAFVATKVSEDEVYLGVPSAASDEYASSIYVFNAKTRAWVKWQRDAWHGFHNAADDKLYLCDRDGTTYDVEKEGGAESFSPVIEWQARSERDPFVCKRWGRLDLGFDTMSGITALTFSHTSDISTTPAGSGALSVSGLTRYTPIPSWVPRQHCMSTVLYPKVTITQSTSPAWRLVGLSLQYEPASIRPRRVEV